MSAGSKEVLGLRDPFRGQMIPVPRDPHRPHRRRGRLAPTGGRSMATYSSDDGRTWSKPTTLVDHPQDDNPYGLLRTRDGSLTCFLSVQAPWYGYTSAPAEMKHLRDGLNVHAGQITCQEVAASLKYDFVDPHELL